MKSVLSSRQVPNADVDKAMLQKQLAYTYLFIAGLLPLNAENFRTFKDTQNREMVAKLTRVSGEDVYIEREDGLSTKVDISLFSKDDQKFIREWAKQALLKSGIFEIRFTTDNTNKERTESGGIERELYSSRYEIVINNTSYEKVKNVRVEYLMLKFEDALAAQKRSEGEIRRVQGSTSIDLIGPRTEVVAKTKQIPMLETKLAPGFVWAGGGKKTSKDTLKGIWVKIYVDDQMVQEYARPESMMRKEPWN